MRLCSSRENHTGEGGTTRASGVAEKIRYWCTICINPVPMTTCDGWKRHEIEQHERYYVCMPYGAVEFSGQGPHCAFCGLSNPDQKHFHTHSVGLCTYKPIEARKYTRKGQFISHLKAHGINDNPELAERWKNKLDYRFYACGFCVALFHSNGDRLNHIDTRHFRRLQTIEEWNPNMVIKGLLLQPAVLNSWRKISTHDTSTADLIWDPHTVAHLQARLQISNEPPERLAAEALSQSSFELHSGHPLPLAPSFDLDVVAPVCRQALLSVPGPQTLASNIGSAFACAQETSDQAPAQPQMLDAAAMEAIDFNLVGVQPPQVLKDTSCENLVSTTAECYYSTGYPSMSNVPPVHPLHTQASYGHLYNDAALNPQYLNYDMMARHSESDSWRSSSCTSTNTSIASLPTTLPSVQYSAQIGSSWPSSSAPRIVPSSSLAEDNSAGHRKPASIVAQLKRRFSRVKVKDAASEPELPMDIDVDNIMRIMEHDQQSRAQIDTHKEVSTRGIL